MVRFIIKIQRDYIRGQVKFTFQYGQIYYLSSNNRRAKNTIIYIPIWLDLL